MIDNHYYRYHVHLTLSKDPPLVPRLWKKTTIVLQGDKTQTDFMITRHFSFIHPFTLKDREDFILSSIVSIIEDFSLSVIRVKIEADDNFEDITHSRYLECHCKVPLEVVNMPGGWIRSNNPVEPDVYFWNRRIRDGGDFYKAVEDVLTELRMRNFYFIPRFEQVIYDSNENVDSWWEFGRNRTPALQILS